MRARLALISLFLLLGACSASTARAPYGEGGPTMVTPLMLEPPPVYSLLGFRDKLQLTPAQITALDSIATSVHDRNEPLIDSLRANATPTRSQVGLLIPDEYRATLEAVRKNNREAATATGKVLTPEQQKSACQIFEEQRQDRERSERNGQTRRPSRLGSEADSILASSRRSVWSWCRNTSPDSL